MTLTVQHLTKIYQQGNEQLQILQDVSFQRESGSALAIMGTSGSGKSTLLHILGVIDPPTSGEVNLKNMNPWKLQPAAQAQFRNQQIGFIFQEHHLLPQCTVTENVLLPTLPGAGINAASEQRAQDLLKRVGLEHRLTHFPGQLSGGERQRVAVCRALMNRPLLVLADEPTGSLDRHSANMVGDLLLELCRELQFILICVTHSQELAKRFPDRAELLNGQLQTHHS